MLRFRDGEAAAFEALYRRHRGPLYRYFVRQATRDVVDDLFQEVWMRVIRARARYRSAGPFAAYLYRIAHNVLVDHYRQSARDADPTDPAALQPQDPGAGPADDYRASELRREIAAALETLPSEQREAFVLQQEAGLTLEEIGHVVGANRETVKSRLRYANQRLRKALAHHELAERRA